MKDILILDNYDSFTYNLVHAIYDILDQEVDVIRNDKLEIADVEKYEYIIFSPGPGVPDEAGKMKEIIAHYQNDKKMLGVCLGHQAIFEVFGGKLENLDKVYHGIQTNMIVTDETCPVLGGLGKNFEAGRYHSWVGQNATVPESLKVTCVDEQDQIMALRHNDLHIYGVQFHPESILTPKGNQLLENFIKL